MESVTIPVTLAPSIVMFGFEALSTLILIVSSPPVLMELFATSSEISSNDVYCGIVTLSLLPVFAFGNN